MAFPYERLPVELQLHIIRSAMPSRGIRVHAKALECLTRGCCPAGWLPIEESIPTSLFLVNRRISDQARRVLYDEVVLHIDVMPQRVDCCRQLAWPIGLLVRFPNVWLERLSGVRNYQINLHFPWYDRSIESISEFIWRYHRIKENLRAVADMLSMNGHILSMTIQVPVSCYSQGRLHPPGHLENLMLAYYVDILAPLGRVCVRKPVTILPVHDCDNTEISTPCTKALDVEFARRTREGMRPLAGGELDHKERTWKEVKIKADQSAAHGPALLHPEQIRRFWGYLDNGHMDGFDTMARLTMQSIQRLEEERFAHGPRHLMQLQQHTLRASQGSDEAAP